MPRLLSLRRTLVLGGLVAVGVAGIVAVRTYLDFRPAAITLGPETTLYLRPDPPVRLRVHEAIHRRQMRDKSPLGRVWSALRYNFDYGYRLEEEAEAKAAELCLRIHRFSADLADYTTARSRFQARTYRAWAWERMGMEVPDRVGARLRGGEACHDILRGVELDLPPGQPMDDDQAMELAAFRFLQAYGSSEREVRTWRARLELASYAEPAEWDLPEEIPRFGLVEVGRLVAPPPDTTIDPTDAGRALHRLTYFMADRMYVQLHPPIRGYRGRPLAAEGEAREHTGAELGRWPDRIVDRALGEDIDDEGVAWLEEVAAHPVHADFETFARAPSADIVGTRYRLPFPEEWDRLVLSELDPVRTVFHAQWGRAALALAREEPGEAADVLRTLVAGSLQWIENSPFEVDVLEGLEILDRALRSLRRVEEEFPEVRVAATASGEDGGEGGVDAEAEGGQEDEEAGRSDGDEEGAGEPEDEDAEDAPVDWVEAYESLEARDWVWGARSTLFSRDLDAVHQAMPVLAGDPGIPHAFKRFAYRQVMLADVCLELREGEAVREAHDRWREAVEGGLVRRESDRQVLELMRRRVRELIRTAEVAPERVCRSSSGLRPGARMAIILAPPRPLLGRVRIEDR